MLIAALLSVFFGVLPAGVMAIVGLATWVLSKMENTIGLVFFGGSAIAAVLGVVSGWGLILALVIGAVLVVLGLKK